MKTFRTNQRRISLHGRELHFVAYEGQPANKKKGAEATPPMWFLMSEGKRHPVMPRVLDQSDTDLDECLRSWAGEHVGGAAEASGAAKASLYPSNPPHEQWWMPD